MSLSLNRALGALAVVALFPVLQQDGAGFKVVKTIPVGGTGTSWDYALADAASHRLYVSHGTEAVVIDTDKDTVIARVTPAPGIHGIAVANDLNKGFTSNGRDTSVTVFDLKTFAALARIVVGGNNPDAIWYDDVSKRVFTMNAVGSLTAIDAVKNTAIGTIPLPGKPEFAQTDGKGLMFVTIETDPGQVSVIDTKAFKELKHYTLEGCAAPTGMAYDRKNNRVFNSCSDSKTLSVSDPTTGKVIVTIPMCTGTDAAAYDPDLHLVFASCSDGTMTVVRQDGPDKYTSLGNATTKAGSRTMAYDVRTHKAYLAAVDRQPRDPNAPPPAGGRGGRGPAAVPGSFHVLVLQQNK